MKAPFKLRWLLICPALVYLFYTFSGVVTVTPVNGEYLAVHQNFAGDTVKVEICIDKYMSLCEEVK